MSAGESHAAPKVSNDLSMLAPKFAQAVVAALAACRAAGFDAIVYEATRSQELQALYYARGRTIIPPAKPVTNAPSNLLSWHGYGLAVDVIDRTKFWKPDLGEGWFSDVAAIFKQHDCSWGGDWKMQDKPHFQWGRCKPSPSPEAQKMLHEQGLQAVWQALGAA